MSSASAATLTAVAVLENGRKLSGKKILFDAHLYLSQNHDPVLALLHYFNDGDLTFTNLGHYVIEANVCASRLRSVGVDYFANKDYYR